MRRETHFHHDVIGSMAGSISAYGNPFAHVTQVPAAHQQVPLASTAFLPGWTDCTVEPRTNDVS